MQMHERGASSRRRKLDGRGENCDGAVDLNESDACAAPMRIMCIWSFGMVYKYGSAGRV